jgi:hypothetical protein
MKELTEPTREIFLNDVANHKLHVKLDQGVYRHLVFEQPRHQFLHRFEIVTTPWRLMITGDMGAWVFARLEDMFEFFRSPDGSINRSYWAEKLQNGAHGCSKEAKVYDGDAYRQRLIESLEGYTITKKKRADIIRELKSMDFDDEHWIMHQINDFSFEGFTFQDVWEIDMTVYSYHFVWCCYAIVWGIQRYDALKTASALVTEEERVG